MSSFDLFLDAFTLEHGHGQSSKKMCVRFSSTFSRMGGAKRNPSLVIARPHRLDQTGLRSDVPHVVLMGYATLHPSCKADVLVLKYGRANSQSNLIPGQAANPQI